MEIRNSFVIGHGSSRVRCRKISVAKQYAVWRMLRVTHSTWTPMNWTRLTRYSMWRDRTWLSARDEGGTRVSGMKASPAGASKGPLEGTPYVHLQIAFRARITG